jgi:hypothetical protein
MINNWIIFFFKESAEHNRTVNTPATTTATNSSVNTGLGQKIKDFGLSVLDFFKKLVSNL